MRLGKKSVTKRGRNMEYMENLDLQYSVEELFGVAAKLARKLTGGESTSITYEKAQQLLEAVVYCIREGASEDGKTQINNLSVWEAYEKGYECVLRKVKRSLALYNKIMEQFDSYGNNCLHDTMVRGMPEFFKRYNPQFAPQETILTLDYPVVEDLREFSGVDVIWEYLLCIREEQKYLGKFPRKFIVESLQSYCEDYEEMIENLRQIVDEYSDL